jgi:glucosamine--fructose-6-phosphate aminotransferase (isomerizing)
MTGQILEREIHEQPHVLDRLLVQQDEHTSAIAKELKDRFEYMVIAARGSSDNAARYAKYLFGAHNQIPVALATPSLYTLYQSPPRMHGACVMGISQSGRSPDILAVLNEAKEQGQPTLAITNDIDSPLANVADYVIDLSAGEEEAVAATKTYTASIMALGLLSAHLEGSSGRIQELRRAPVLVRDTLERNQEAIEEAKRYHDIEHCIVIARGFNYATAFEIALKLKELTQIIAEPYSSADFMHGPIAMIRQGFPILLVVPKGEVLTNFKVLIDRLEQREANLLIVSNDPKLLGMASLAMPVPENTPEWITPLLTVLPGQLFSLGLARARGLDPDEPEGLTKITETW